MYPILETNCLPRQRPSDGTGYPNAHLRLETYRSLMQGTRFRRTFNMLVEGSAEASRRMPHQRDEPQTAQEIETRRLRVNQGARAG